MNKKIKQDRYRMEQKFRKRKMQPFDKKVLTKLSKLNKKVLDLSEHETFTYVRGEIEQAVMDVNSAIETLIGGDEIPIGEIGRDSKRAAKRIKKIQTEFNAQIEKILKVLGEIEVSS